MKIQKPLYQLLLLLSLYLSFSIVASAQYTKLQGTAGQGGVQPTGLSSTKKFQQTFPSCTVTVYIASTATIATIYTNASGTPKANPFTASSDATWFFYGVAGQHYDVTFSGTGIASPFTIGDLVAPTVGTTLINVQSQYGAKGDGKVSIAGGSITATSTTLTCSDCAFTSTSVDAGKLIDIEGAGASGVNLVTTIATVTNSTTATISVAASTTVSNKHVVYGSNDKTAIQNALNAGRNVYLPRGNYIIGASGLNVTTNGTTISGDGMYSSVLYPIGIVKLSSGTYFTAVNIDADQLAFKSIGVNGTNWRAETVALGTTPDGFNSFLASDDIDFVDCRADYTWGIGFHANGAESRWRFTTCQANYNAADGFNPNTTDLQMLACRGIANGTGGIETSGSNISITGGVYSQNRNVGIAIGGRTDTTTGRLNNVTGVTIERNQTGITISSNSQMTAIVGCTIRQNDTIGIALSNPDTTPTASYANRYNLVEGNIISSNGCTSAGSCISGVVSGTVGQGIYCASPLNLIQHNYIFDEGIANFAQQYGIQIASGVDSVKVLLNHVTGSANKDYLFNGATNLLFTNDVATSTIQSIGTTFIYASPTVNVLTINQMELQPSTTVADTSLNPFTPTNLRNVFVTLTGNRTLDAFNGVNGQIITFIFVQDGTGNRTLSYGGTFKGATAIGAGQSAGKINTQTFMYTTSTGWIAISAAVQNQ